MSQFDVGTVSDWNAEYFFAESILAFNKLRHKHHVNVITVSDARTLHTVFMDAVQKLMPSAATLTEDASPDDPDTPLFKVTARYAKVMLAAFNETIAGANGGHGFYSEQEADTDADTVENTSNGVVCICGFANTQSIIQNIMVVFEHITGWCLEDGNEIALSKISYVPVTPYDRRFADRAVIMNHGGQIFWASQEDLFKQQEQTLVIAETSPENPVSLFVLNPDFDVASKYDTTDGQTILAKDCVLESGYSLYDEDDASGLSRLRPFMTDAEYDSVHTRVASSGVRMSPEALDKSVAILTWLLDNGYDFEIKADKSKDQLMAAIKHTDITVRLTDKKEFYIGRYYSGGYSAFTSSFRTVRSNDAQDCIDVLAYMLGQSVPMRAYNDDDRMYLPGGRRMEKGTRRYEDHIAGAPVAYRHIYAGQPLVVMSHRDKTTYNPVFDYSSYIDAYNSDEDDTYPDMYIVKDVVSVEVSKTASYTRRNIKKMTIRSDRHSVHAYFKDADEAAAFLAEAISTARSNYEAALNIDYLVQEFAANGDDENYIPAFSANPLIEPVQARYWDILTGRSQDFQAALTDNELDDAEADDTDELFDPDEDFVTAILSRNISKHYEGNPEEQIRQHLSDTLAFQFGSLNTGKDGKRFNPALVAKFMRSSASCFRNIDDLIAAVSACNISGDELRGNEFQVGAFKDKLIKFNPETAHQMDAEHASLFMRSLAKTIEDTIRTTNCTVDAADILIDDNGIVHYTAKRFVKNADSALVFENVEGYVGQIFEPDGETGVVETKFAGSRNRLFTPGTLIYVLPQKKGETKSFVQRMRGRGYLQVLQKGIQMTVRKDLMDPHPVVGTTTNLNRFYSGLHRTTYKVLGHPLEGETLLEAYLREQKESNTPEHITLARFKTNALSFRLPTDLKENSGLKAYYDYHARLEADDCSVEELMRDSSRDAFSLSDHTNVAVLGTWGDGYFDKIATGSAKNQGIIRYGAEGMSVDPDTGALRPARNPNGTINKDARAAIMRIPEMRYADNVPFDRQQMVQSNLQGALSVDSNTCVAFLTAAGYTFDDGSVISKKWAESHPVFTEAVDADGNEISVRRPLKAGDKICDFAGNKSIIAKVVDTALSKEVFDCLSDIDKALVRFMQNNDTVDVIMSPYSPMSRFNAASARFAINDHFEITMPDGSVTYGGRMPMMVTDKTVDEKTKEYGDEDVKAGKGRSASGQLNWIIGALGANALLDDMYGGNDSSYASLREYLITMGMDISPSSELLIGYHPYPTADGPEQRRVFALPSLAEVQHATNNDLMNRFSMTIDNAGGFLEIPFPLVLPSGVSCEPVEGKEGLYKLPILSSYLRSGQTYEDGTIAAHDYSNHYAAIYVKSIEYLKETSLTDTTNALQKKNHLETMDALKKAIINEYRIITSGIQSRIFEGKHNIIRSAVMSHRLPHSATAVWSPSANCALDEVRMPSSMAATLGKRAGEEVLLWRDPCLHWSNAVALKVVIDDSLTGIQVNPLIEARMDGDNDGDSVGIYGPQSKAAIADLHDKLGLAGNLLDTRHPAYQKDEHGNIVYKNGMPQKAEPEAFELFINTKMDVTSIMQRDLEYRESRAKAGNPVPGISYKARLEELAKRANDIYFERDDFSDITPAQKAAFNQYLLNELSEWSKDIFGGPYGIGAQILSMKDLGAYIVSLEQMAADRSKGKQKNIAEVLKYYGAECDTAPDGKYDLSTLSVQDRSRAERNDNLETERATAVKSGGTPLAGMFSVNAAEALRTIRVQSGPHAGEHILKYVLDLTYNATQGVLQAKHDSVLAEQQYRMLLGPLKSLWQGHKLEAYEVPLYEVDKVTGEHLKTPRRDAEGNIIYQTRWKEVTYINNYGNCVPMGLKTTEWIRQFCEIHDSKDGMNLEGEYNIEHVQLVAEALTNKHGYIYDLESSKCRQDLGTTLDRLGYTPSFRSLLAAAKNHECLFCQVPAPGGYNVTEDMTFHLAPRAVQRQILAAHGIIDSSALKRAFGKSDMYEQKH